MKIFKKLIPTIAPITATIIVAPTALTSCSKVYVDIFNKGYEPKIEPVQSDKPLNEQQVTEEYFKGLQKYGDELIKDDMLWSCANLEKMNGTKNYTDAAGDTGTIWYTKYIVNVSKHKYNKEKSTKDGIIISYYFSGEMEYELQDINETKSYKKVGIQFEWEMRNIEFTIKSWDSIVSGSENKYWVLTPKKFGEEHYWESLMGDEYIAFNFRNVSKGFSEDGVQNYGYEDREQAIIDEQHKYTPRLDEPLTAFFLYDSAYLHNIKHAE